MKDTFGRKIEYMRISITDRCNLRCKYCMPDDITLVPMSQILTYEQIEEIVEEAAKAGIKKIKITGGEPLVRLGCPNLVGMIKKIPGIEQVTLTTNGVLLSKYLPELLQAGLDAVNISLDSLDPNRFEEITRYNHLSEVLQGIEDALAAGLRVKVNVVPQIGVNEQELLDLARLAKDRPLDVRFIEMMPIGSGKGFDYITNDSIMEELNNNYKGIIEDHSEHGNGPAIYYKIPGFQGSIGFISAMHGKFCGSCNRIRLTSQGKLKPCLCFGETVDLMPALQIVEKEERQEKLLEGIRAAIARKPEQHKFENKDDVTEERLMSGIGG